MTVTILVEELIAFLSDKTKNIILETPTDGVVLAPQYIDGYLPPKKSTDRDDYPCVIIRPDNGTDTASGVGMSGEVTVKILIGTYSEDIQGYQYAVTLLEIIRRELLKERIIGKSFDLQSFSWNFPDEQPYPNWWIQCNASFSVVVPTESNYITEGAYGESY